jgi:hypothetical protein
MARRMDFTEISIGMAIPFNEDIQLPDGTVGHFHMENPVVDNDGRVVGFVVSFYEEGEHDHGNGNDGHHHMDA